MFHADLKFMNGYQKFIELTNRYTDALIRIQAKEALAYVPSRAKELSNKIREVSSAYADNEYARRYLHRNTKELNYLSFKGYFTQKDISTLSIIGTLKTCIDLQRQSSGADALEDKLNSILENIALRNVVKNKVTNKQRDVMKIVSNMKQCNKRT